MYQPDVIIDNRLEGSGEDHGSIATAEPSIFSGDFASPEQIIPPEGIRDQEGELIPWELCATMNNHWGYCNFDHTFKSSQMLIPVSYTHLTKPLSKEYSYRDETDLFNDEKLAMYINGIWGAFMIDETLPVSYALLPFGEGAEIACESAGLGYLLGNTENEKRIDASIKFLKYMLSKEVQERILLKTGQRSV